MVRYSVIQNISLLLVLLLCFFQFSTASTGDENDPEPDDSNVLNEGNIELLDALNEGLPRFNPQMLGPLEYHKAVRFLIEYTTKIQTIQCSACIVGLTVYSTRDRPEVLAQLEDEMSIKQSQRIALIKPLIV